MPYNLSYSKQIHEYIYVVVTYVICSNYVEHRRVIIMLSLFSVFMSGHTGDVTTINTGKISYWLAPRSQHANVLAFKVRACSDAHVILSSTQSASTAKYYEISLGIDGGRRSLLKFDNDPRDQVVSSTAVLDCKHDRQFWLHWDADTGLVRIGEGLLYGFNVLLSWTNPDPFEIEAIGLSTKNSVPGRWRLLNNAGMHECYIVVGNIVMYIFDSVYTDP